MLSPTTPAKTLQTGASIVKLLGLIFVALLLVVVGIAGLYWWSANGVYEKSGVSQLNKIEQSLHANQHVALAHFNVSAARQLEDMFFVTPAKSPTHQYAKNGLGLPAKLHTIMDIGRDIDHLIFSLNVDKTEQTHRTFVLMGRIPVDKVVELLKSEYQATEQNGYWRFKTINQETCEVDDEVMVHVSEPWIVWSSPAFMNTFMRNMAKDIPSDASLQQWQTYRSNKLVSAGLFFPKLAHKAASGFGGMMIQGAANKIEPVNALFAGVSIQSLPPALAAEVSLYSKDSAWINSTQNSWTQAVAKMRDEMGAKSPAAGQLFNALDIQAADDHLVSRVTIDQTLADNASEALQDAISSMFSFGGQLGSTQQAQEERIDEDAPMFQASVDPKSIPAFKPGLDTFFDADVTQGPFGFMLESIELDKDGHLLLVVKTQAHSIPNLGKNSYATIAIDKVESFFGEDYLFKQSCGRQRNDEPSDLDTNTYTSVFKDNNFIKISKVEGKKSIKLIADAKYKNIASIIGHVRVDLPTKTERVVISPPFAGQHVVADQSELVIKSVEGGNLRYEIAGDSSPFLTVRALNAQQKVLAQKSSSSSGRLFGEGLRADADYQGNIAFIEVVIAREVATQKYPYKLTKSLPEFGSSSKRDIPRLKRFSEFLYNEKFATESPPTIERPQWQQEPNASVTSGPFTIELTDFNKGIFGVSGSLNAYAPMIPSMDFHLSAMRYELNSVTLDDGTSLPLNETIYAEFQAEKGMFMNGEYKADEDASNYLKSNKSFRVEAGDKRSSAKPMLLNGKAILRFPKKLDVARIAAKKLGEWQEAGPLQTRVTRISNNQIKLEVKGPREQLARVSVYSANNDPIGHASDSEKADDHWDVSVSFEGEPEYLLIIYSTDADELVIPLAFQVK